MSFSLEEEDDIVDPLNQQGRELMLLRTHHPSPSLT